MNPKDLLVKTTIFSSLPDKHLNQIAERLARQDFQRGEDLMTQGEEGRSLFLIESGTVGVFITDADFKLSIEVAQLGPGECVGELSLITGEKRTATCAALSEVVAHRLDRAVFEAILQQSPSVQSDLMKTMASRLTAVQSKQSVPFISLSRIEPNPQLTAMIPQQVIRRHAVVPVSFEDGALTLATVDPTNTIGFNEVKRLLQGVRVRPVVVNREDFDRFTERLVGSARTSMPPARQSLQPRLQQPIRFLTDEDERESRVSVSGSEVTELVNRIIVTGIVEGASDIHIEPTREGTRIRFRIHGSLEKRIPVIPIESHRPLLSRFKVLSKLDITKERKPQEGRISLEIEERSVDLRLSFVPTKLGQKLVIRILDASTTLLALDKLILARKVRQVVRQMFYAPHGVVLVTGPTGSGKTTMLYSALLERRTPEISITTVEDPVEFHLDGLSQVEVGGNASLSFADVLRAFLRQDPDIILVGETRDAETAKLALQAGLTGRLVFTSFHTNDCVSAVVRLFEMGMEPFAMANSLVGVIHQRLVRRLCPHCRIPFEYYPEILDNLRAANLIGAKPPTLYRPQGCTKCNGQGFAGRVGALEVMVITESVRAAIARQASPTEIIAAATGGAFVPLARYLNFLLEHGLTIPGEALGALPRTSN